MPIVYIGIGSNLGDRVRNCSLALELLEEEGIIIRQRSSLHETEPWGVKDQPRFLNMAVEIETGFSPRELLHIVKDIEKRVGRTESYRWGPRVVDLDILLYNDIVFRDDELEIPHPFMQEREFVLKSLCEIAPDIRHPVSHLSIRELLFRLNTGSSACHGES